jgi:hypothetical protein
MKWRENVEMKNERSISDLMNDEFVTSDSYIQIIEV